MTPATLQFITAHQNNPDDPDKFLQPQVKRPLLKRAAAHVIKRNVWAGDALCQVAVSDKGPYAAQAVT